MEDMPDFDVSDDFVENMSGFTGSNESPPPPPPVGNMSGFSVRDDCMAELSPSRVEKMLNDSGDSLKFSPGLRFKPTDEEIITYYLCGKIGDSSFCASAIGEVDLKIYNPWEFPVVPVGKREWFFYSRRDMKYANQRIERTTRSGYWKATGKDRPIFEEKTKTLVGVKKLVVFYRGKEPCSGERTDWVMHEYRLVGPNSLHNLTQKAKNEWVVCKVYLKGSLEELKPSMNHHPFLMSLLQTKQNPEKLDTTHKRKKCNDEYVAVSSCSVNAHNNTTLKEYGGVRVKVGYNNDIVMFMLPFATMESLNGEILKRYKIEAETFKIRYKDEDEEMVTIACDEDLHYCLKFFESTGAPVKLSLLMKE